MLRPQKHRLPEVLALSDLKEHKDGKLKGLPMFDNVRHQIFSLSCDIYRYLEGTRKRASRTETRRARTETARPTTRACRWARRTNRPTLVTKTTPDEEDDA